MLRMGFDFDDDIAVMLFDLGKSETPISLDQFFFVVVHRLKKHIGLVPDVVGPQKCLEGFLEVVVL